jgi:hypothetical protein
MMDDLTPILSRLPEPMPASTLTATVMARIEREAEEKADAKAAAPASRAREFQTWLWTLVGVSLGLVVFINGWLSAGSLPDFTAARIGPKRAPLMPIGTSASLLLAVGLLVYVAGLFAPLRSERD